MGDVIRLPIIPRPIPVAAAGPFTAIGEPHTDVKNAFLVLEKFALENCGAAWTAMFVADRLWRLRARVGLEKQL